MLIKTLQQMYRNIERYEAQSDQQILDAYPEPNRDMMIFISVTRNIKDKVLHWRIAWEAVDPTGKVAGYKVLEVKSNRIGTLGASATDSNDFVIRFSFRPHVSTSMARWHNYGLWFMSPENRKNLRATAENWEYNGEGNCISFVMQTVYDLTDAGAFGEDDAVKRAVKNQLRIACADDLATGLKYFHDLHNTATMALRLT